MSPLCRRISAADEGTVKPTQIGKGGLRIIHTVCLLELFLFSLNLLQVILVDTIPLVLVGLAIENRELCVPTSLESSQGAKRQIRAVRSARKAKLSEEPQIGQHPSKSSIDSRAVSFVLHSNPHSWHSCYRLWMKLRGC